MCACVFRLDLYAVCCYHNCMNVLFVCSSNICRSPYCEFIFRRMIDDDEILSRYGITVSSAAVLNKSKEIFPKTVSALVSEGFNAEELLSFSPCHKKFGEQRFACADIIIGMSRFHKWLTPKAYRHKYITLSELAEGRYSPIPDPFLINSQQKYDDAMNVLKGYLFKYKCVLKKSMTAK